VSFVTNEHGIEMRDGILFIDCSRPRKPRKRQRRSEDIKALGNLLCGEVIVHDHNGYQTKMGSWLATQRHRFGHRPFNHEPIAGTGQTRQFFVWVGARPAPKIFRKALEQWKNRQN
jgi:hypothetical protein